ncbi:MAG TPA: hypothetical protein VFG79_20220, partial [Solirubrobacter sp.]|nr:hypothetical protein [Solirubrobacter sp.]
VEAERGADPQTRFFEALPARRRAAALAALNGARPVGLRAVMPGGGVLQRSDHGCTSAAERRLYGNLRRWYRISRSTDELREVWTARVLTDSRYRAGVRRWAACMRRRGRPYRTPAAARARALAPGAPPGLATRIAVAEARCAHRSRLAATARRLDAAYRRRVRASYRTQLRARARMERAALPRARAVLARPHDRHTR